MVKFQKLLLFSLFLSSAFPQSKPVDLCAPPPGSFPPSLPAKLLEGQGRVHFPITTSSPKAQEFFNQGIAQMHSFWFNEAERSFLQAAELDPQAPMPHWGIAMVANGDYRPSHQLEYFPAPRQKKPYEGASLRALEGAQKALKLSAVPQKATPIEKLYIAAVAARRDPKSKEPDAEYIRGLRAILARYPSEVEAKTYLALHLMRGFATPDKTPRSGSLEAVALLKELQVQAPDHPGVHHYVIHGLEGSSFTKDALPSCKRYAELVPNIPHALHMPGHIYSQTGRWNEAVASFERAAENERGYIKADQLYGLAHHGHNLEYLANSYGFLGEFEKAVGVARSLLALKENPREAAQVDNAYGPYRRGFFSLLSTLIHFERWDDLLMEKTLSALNTPRERAWRHFGLGLAYAAKGEANAAKGEARAMDAALRDFKLMTKKEPPPYFKVAREELKGHIALASNRLEAGLKTLQKASLMERALRYSEPPEYPRPVLESLGRAALRHGRLPMAESAFREALVQFPESSHATAGLRETLRRARKPEAPGL